VKVIHKGNRFFLHLGKHEKELMFGLLKLYPQVPSAYQPLSKSTNLPDQEPNQKLLDEALAEQRAENKKQLERLLANRRRSVETEAGHRLSLSAGDIEWLLQILNDIHVGSWVLLGSPDDRNETMRLTARTAPHFVAMKMAGDFQAGLLEALEDET